MLRTAKGLLGFCLLLVLGPVWQALGQGSDTDAAGRTPQEMSDRIDALLERGLLEQGWPAAELCGDAEFLRRAHLDLTGQPPTASQVVSFCEKGGGAEQRRELIDRLLASPRSANHLAATWTGWLLPEAGETPGTPGNEGLQGWLRSRFAENLRYDRLVSDLLVASGSPQSGPTAFFVALEGKPEKIAARTARVFLGLQLDCAECHDHPFDRWSQRDFWGFAAYFARLSIGEGMAMRPDAEVADVAAGEVRLPGEDEVVPPRPLVATGLSEVAFGSRRQQLALWLTAPENPFVARAAVNRAWALLFGRGLIEPVDDMRNLELASHPELLRELADYFAASGYDLRELLAVLANTQAYQRSGLHPSGIPPADSYAVMPAKPLTAAQMTASLASVARQALGEDNSAAQQALQQQLGTLRGDGNEAKLGVVAALVTLHGAAFDAVCRTQSSRLLKALDAPHLDSRQQFRWLFLATLNREPSPAEEQAFSQHLLATSHDDPQGDWRSDLLWALLNSTEFAMTP